MLEITICQDEVQDLLSKLNASKACGLDDIPARLLKEGAPWIASPLNRLFNLSLSQGHLPRDWTSANVTPIFKNGSKHSVANYRPISLTCIVVKTLETLLHNHLTNSLRDKLSHYQHGFQKGHSCQTLLLKTVHEWAQNLNRASSTHVIFSDFSKAFELHEFLPKPLNPKFGVACHCCHNQFQHRTTRTVADVFTWILCYNWYMVAMASVKSKLIPGMLAHTKSIIQEAQQFKGDGWRVYDRAFWLQAASTPDTDWSTINLSLYACTFMATNRRRNVCRFCCSKDHSSYQCPWGVDTSISGPQSGRQSAPQWSRLSHGQQICMYWNTSACKFPYSCNFRHICSTCSQRHRRIECPCQPLSGYPEVKHPGTWSSEAKRPGPQ